MALRQLLVDDGDCLFLSRSELDITDSVQVRKVVSEASCDWVINAAAYTAVDAAETDEETAFRVNAVGPQVLAAACLDSGARLAHVSTDFVFDGVTNRPYKVSDRADPVSVYGRSKLAGEQAVAEALGGDGLVVRTSWLYGGEQGNFVSTMLRLMRSRDELSVVSDQIGTPTWSRTLAAGILGLVDLDERGVHHVTDSGSASWYDFAVAIREISFGLGLIPKRPVIHPIPSEEYPTPATRPRFSMLDRCHTDKILGKSPPHWRESLEQFLVSVDDQVDIKVQLGG